MPGSATAVERQPDGNNGSQCIFNASRKIPCFFDLASLGGLSNLDEVQKAFTTLAGWGSESTCIS